MKTQSAKVLFCSTYFDFPFWGGSEKFWYEVLLDQRMHEQFACKVLIGDNSLTREKARSLRSLGAEVQLYSVKEASLQSRVTRRLRRIVGSHAPQNHSCVQQLMREIVVDQPALVWFNLTTVSDVLFVESAAQACQKKNIPYWLVVTHAFENFFLSDSEQTERCATVFEGAKRVLCLSKRNRDALERMTGRHLKNMWMTVNAVSAQFLEQASEAARHSPVHVSDQARFLNVARFEPSIKGQHRLLEVFSDRQWKTRDWVLTLQGAGALSPLRKRLVDYYGLAGDRVRLIDDDPDMLRALTKSDVFLMPSLSEGMPFALLEAMACSRPSVGTPVGGIPELIIEGDTGWMARSTETADVADALERAWSARTMWPIFGERAQATVKRSYNQEITIAKLVAALQDDIGG